MLKANQATQSSIVPLNTWRAAPKGRASWTVSGEDGGAAGEAWVLRHVVRRKVCHSLRVEPERHSARRMFPRRARLQKLRAWLHVPASARAGRDGTDQRRAAAQRVDDAGA